MANDSFKIKNSLNIAPKSAPTLNAEGDVGFDSADSKLKYRDAGATRSVVSEDGTQTLTNKTLTSPTLDTATLSSPTITGTIEADAVTDVDLGTTNTATSIDIGTGTGANVINLGGVNTTVNMYGLVNNQAVTNLVVTDKIVTLNDGGAVSSGGGAGIEIEEANSITAYASTSGDRNSWEFKAPNTAGVATITPGTSSDTVVLANAAQTLTNKIIGVSQLDGQVSEAKGGTSQSTYATGDLLYASAANTLSKLVIGSTNNVLSVSAGGIPEWSSAAGGLLAVTTKTGTYTATTSDNIINCDATGGSFTVTLYASSGNTGRTLTIRKTDSSLANRITVDGNASETIDGALTRTLCTLHESITLVCDGTNWLITDRKIPSVWTSYSPAARSTGTTPAYGSSHNLIASWKRIGESIAIKYAYVQGSAGVNGTGDYFFNIPTGLSILESYNDSSNFGPAYVWRQSFGLTYTGYVAEGDASGFTIKINTGAGFNRVGVAATFGYNNTAEFDIGFTAMAKISGWEG